MTLYDSLQEMLPLLATSSLVSRSHIQDRDDLAVLARILHEYPLRAGHAAQFTTVPRGPDQVC